jgi:hypothetical protein
MYQRLTYNSSVIKTKTIQAIQNGFYTCTLNHPLFRNPSIERLTTVASLAVIIAVASLCALLVLFIEVITVSLEFNPI